MDYVMKDQVHQRSLEWPQDVPGRKCRVLPSADNVLTLENHVKIKMDNHEASGSCLLAGSWWIGSSSLGHRTSVELAGPATWRAVGESGVHQRHPHRHRLLDLSAEATFDAGGDGNYVDEPRTIS